MYTILQVSPLTLATSVSVIVYTSIAVSTIFETVRTLLRPYHPFPLYSNRPPVVPEAGLGGVQRLALYTVGGGSFSRWDLSEDLREGAGRLIMVSYRSG